MAKANGKTTKTVTMKVHRITPGTVVCTELDDKGNENKVDPLSGSIYLKKAAVGDLPIGTLVTVTVEY